METQPAALSVTAVHTPPPLLERAVQFLLPPAARETIGGDLCEMYRSPLQYAWQAATTLPFVVASQARRNANWPVLGLQGLILYACFHGLFAITHGHQAAASYALPATAASLLLLFLHEAYQEQERPGIRRAILETILLSGLVMLLFPQHFLMGMALKKVQVWWPGFALLGSLMAMIPVLCCLRAGMILDVDRRHPPLQNQIAAEDLGHDYRRFHQRNIVTNRLEGTAMGTAAILYALLGGKLGAGYSAGNGMVVGAYAAAALYLMLEGRPASPAVDFLSLRALYQDELARRHQLRRFLCWLWCAPFFLIAYTNLIAPGIAADRSSDITWGLLAALLLGFFISALTREGAGPVQEKIALLNRLEPA